MAEAEKETSPETHYRWRAVGEWLWLLRIPVFASVLALGLFITFWRRGNMLGAISSLAWLGAIVLSVVVWRRQAAHARKLYQKHRITSEELAQTKHRTMTEEIVEVVENSELVAWLSLPRSLDEENLEAQRARWDDLYEEGSRHFLLDASRLEELTSKGVQALESFDSMLSEEKGSLLLLNVPTEVRLRLELLSPKLGKQLYSDRESAMWVVWGRLS